MELFAVYNASDELFIDCEKLTAIVGIYKAACVAAYGPGWKDAHADGMGLVVKPIVTG